MNFAGDRVEEQPLKYKKHVLKKYEKKLQVISWKYKLLFDNDISRGTLTAMAGLIVLAIMV